ncbi:conserved hypothetical protein [Ricinus communis]|uniref:Uncharacterized protein n=1 Tax=Ricinus communis TaxID=3988 RepID=B9RCH6_RICCO|nr:conserved hypothetical protein [Ricinus communis]
MAVAMPLFLYGKCLFKASFSFIFHEHVARHFRLHELLPGQEEACVAGLAKSRK